MVLTIKLSKSIVEYLFKNFRFSSRLSNTVDLENLEVGQLQELAHVIKNTQGVHKKEDVIVNIDQFIKNKPPETIKILEPFLFSPGTSISEASFNAATAGGFSSVRTNITYEDYKELYSKSDLNLSYASPYVVGLLQFNITQKHLDVLLELDTVLSPETIVMYMLNGSELSRSEITWEMLKAMLSMYQSYLLGGNPGIIYLRMDLDPISSMSFGCDYTSEFIVALRKIGYKHNTPTVYYYTTTTESMPESAKPVVNVSVSVKYGRDFTQSEYEKYFYFGYSDYINSFSEENDYFYTDKYQNFKSVINLTFTNSNPNVSESDFTTLLRKISSSTKAVNYVVGESINNSLTLGHNLGTDLTLTVPYNTLAPGSFKIAPELISALSSNNIIIDTTTDFELPFQIGSQPYNMFEFSRGLQYGSLISEPTYNAIGTTTETYAEYVSRFDLNTNTYFRKNIIELEHTVPMVVHYSMTEDTKKLFRRSDFRTFMGSDVTYYLREGDPTSSNYVEYRVDDFIEMFEINNVGDLYKDVITTIPGVFGFNYDGAALYKGSVEGAFILSDKLSSYISSVRGIYVENESIKSQLTVKETNSLDLYPLVTSVEILRGSAVSEIEYNKVKAVTSGVNDNYSTYITKFNQAGHYIGSDSYFLISVKANLDPAVLAWLYAVDYRGSDVDSNSYRNQPLFTYSKNGSLLGSLTYTVKDGNKERLIAVYNNQSDSIFLKDLGVLGIKDNYTTSVGVL